LYVLKRGGNAGNSFRFIEACWKTQDPNFVERVLALEHRKDRVHMDFIKEVGRVIQKAHTISALLSNEIGCTFLTMRTKGYRFRPVPSYAIVEINATNQAGGDLSF